MSEGLWREVRRAGRMLRRNPGFALLAALVLALGIGANATVFSFIEALLLRRPSAVEPERLVRLYATRDQCRQFDVFSFPNFEDLRERSQSLEKLTAHQSVRVSLGLGAEARNAEGELVTGD